MQEEKIKGNLTAMVIEFNFKVLTTLLIWGAGAIDSSIALFALAFWNALQGYTYPERTLAIDPWKRTLVGRTKRWAGFIFLIWSIRAVKRGCK